MNFIASTNIISFKPQTKFIITHEGEIEFLKGLIKRCASTGMHNLILGGEN